MVCSGYLTTKQAQRLTRVEKVDYNTPMPRPRKHGRVRMDTDLRIPLTSEQNALIVQATSDEPQGMAAWARAILLRTARSPLARARVNKAEQR